MNEIQEKDGLVYTKEITKKTRKVRSKIGKHQSSINCEDRPVGTVTIGPDSQLIWVPGNSTIPLTGKLSKLVAKGTYIIELAVHKNLPSSVVVNQSYVTPKVGQVAVILINTNNRNIWIHQPLLAAEMHEVELHLWQYCSVYTKMETLLRLDSSQ